MKRYRAESFDLMQYFYGKAHEPLIHALLRFPDHLDEDILKQAVTLSCNVIPMIRCCFVSDARKPYWEDRGFTGEEIVHVIKGDPSIADQAERLLTETIDIVHEPQLKIFLIRSAQADSLSVIINHMVCDGAGFKEYLVLLSSIYSSLLNGGEPKNLIAGPRNVGRLFKNLSFSDICSIALSKPDMNMDQTRLDVKLEGDKTNPFFVTHQIDASDLSVIKAQSKKRNATLNDIFLAAYARVLKKQTGERKIAFPCPVDLRKYLAPDCKFGISNLTSNYLCSIEISDGEPFEITVNNISSQMKAQKDNLACLKPLMLLMIAFKILPFRVLQDLFPKIFTIPKISYSNLGVLEKDRLRFGTQMPSDAFLTGAIKYIPYFQVAISSYDGMLTLSSNLYGTGKDKETIVSILKELHKELMQP